MPASTLETKVRRELLRAVVAHAITCPITGEVLDMDTCVVFVDGDGDPRAVTSQVGYQTILRVDAGRLDVLKAGGIVVDETTIRS